MNEYSSKVSSHVYRLRGDLRGFWGDDVWIVDGKITYSPPASNVATKEVNGYIYPGLVDAHTHPGASYTEQLVNDAEIHRRLDASASLGVTHIRDCGGQRDANDVRREDQPKVIHCGQHIARHKRYIRYLGIDTEPEELVKQVQYQCSKADGWIKIVGDWIDRSNGEQSDLEPLWPRQAILDAVAAAHDLNTKVTVHTFAHATINDLLDAGVDGIEHGTGMTWDQLVQAREQGILITPTVNQVSRFPEFAADASKYPVYAKHMLDMDARRRAHLAMMVDAKVHFLMGSDTSFDVNKRGLPYELCDAVSQGMPVDVAMGAASFEGRRRLGLTTWEEGAAADFVVYTADPLKEISTVLSPRCVFIDGICVRES